MDGCLSVWVCLAFICRLFISLGTLCLLSLVQNLALAGMTNMWSLVPTLPPPRGHRWPTFLFLSVFAIVNTPVACVRGVKVLHWRPNVRRFLTRKFIKHSARRGDLHFCEFHRFNFHFFVKFAVNCGWKQTCKGCVGLGKLLPVESSLG